MYYKNSEYQKIQSSNKKKIRKNVYTSTPYNQTLKWNNIAETVQKP